YTVQDTERLTADLVVHDTCGGGAACSPPPPVPVAPLPVDRSAGQSSPFGALQALPQPEHGAAFAVSTSHSRWPRDVGRLLQAATHAGIRQVVAEPHTLQLQTVQRTFDELVLSIGMATPLVSELPPAPGGDDGLEVLPSVATLLLLGPD